MRQQERAAKLIESRLDDKVAQLFRRYKEELPTCLEEIDHEMDKIFGAYLDAQGVVYERTESWTISNLKLRFCC